MSKVAQMSDYQTHEVVIDRFTVRQDSEGRYCLNDVHEARGTSSTHVPRQWTRYEAQGLVEKLIVGNPIIKPLVA